MKGSQLKDGQWTRTAVSSSHFTVSNLEVVLTHKHGILEVYSWKLKNVMKLSEWVDQEYCIFEKCVLVQMR